MLIFLIVFALLLAVWFFMSALTIFLFVRYAGQWAATWAVVAVYVGVACVLLLIALVTMSKLDFETIIPFFLPY